jgi:hypothetical protein
MKVKNECQGCWVNYEFCLIYQCKKHDICPCKLCLIKPMCSVVCDERYKVMKLLRVTCPDNPAVPVVPLL